MTRWHAILLFFFLSACTQGGNPVPPEMKSTLVGYWDQAEGSGIMHFYADDTVKIELPNRQPPIRIISSYELLKGDRIGIDSGNVWNGPLVITLPGLKNDLILDIPGKEAMTLHFHKRETKR